MLTISSGLTTNPCSPLPHHIKWSDQKPHSWSVQKPCSTFPKVSSGPKNPLSPPLPCNIKSSDQNSTLLSPQSQMIPTPPPRPKWLVHTYMVRSVSLPDMVPCWFNYNITHHSNTSALIKVWYQWSSGGIRHISGWSNYYLFTCRTDLTSRMMDFEDAEPEVMFPIMIQFW